MSFKKGLMYFTLLAGIFIFGSCEKNDEMMTKDCIKGEGTITTSILPITSFQGIDAAMSSNVTIIQGTTQKVEATGHPNIIDLVSTTVSSGIWKITFKNDDCIEDFELSFMITVPSINQLTVSGSGDVTVNNFSNQSELKIDASGSGDLAFNSFEGITALDIKIGGSGNVSGNSDILSLESLNVVSIGSGNYSGFSVSANDCTVKTSGSGKCKITAQNTLNVTISGSGDVSYKGMPTITQNITGSGKLIDAN